MQQNRSPFRAPVRRGLLCAAGLAALLALSPARAQTGDAAATAPAATGPAAPAATGPAAPAAAVRVPGRKPPVPPPPAVETPATPAAPKPGQRTGLIKAPPAYLPEVTPIPPATDPEGVPPAPRTDLPPPPETRVAPGPVPVEVAGRAAVAIDFAPGSDGLGAAADTVLQGVARRLAEAPGDRLELRAHAALGADGETGARRLALARALAVRARLMALGVPKQRMLVFALGTDGAEGGADRVELSFRR
ncbi:OmpA family protein [Rhodocista pekingensis]|uniref:OmpA family protein n=1 Tax=Rhodocista pekingensis TaxID=201185 RepID=A0ABW2KVH7_9PROT